MHSGRSLLSDEDDGAGRRLSLCIARDFQAVAPIGHIVGEDEGSHLRRRIEGEGEVLRRLSTPATGGDILRLADAIGIIGSSGEIDGALS